MDGSFDGFVFEDLAPGEVASDTEAAAAATAACRIVEPGNKRSKTAEQQDTCCMVCRQPRANAKSKYCAVHKRAQESIFRDASKDKTSAEWAAYQEVFADELRAAKCLADFLEQHPDGKSKRGMSRGQVNWSEYTHSYRAGLRAADRDVCRKLDYEVFVKLMERNRGWPLQRANREWETLKNNPDIGRDQNGPTEHQLRLFVPGSITGLDEQVREKFTEEDKSLKQGFKPKAGAFNSTDIGLIKGELNKGMSSTFAASSNLAGNFVESLPQTALTNETSSKAMSVGDLLMNSLGGKRVDAGTGVTGAVAAGHGTTADEDTRSVSATLCNTQYTHTRMHAHQLNCHAHIF